MMRRRDSMHDNAEYVKLARRECALWNGPVNSAGYGPHRSAWEAANGPIPRGLEVDHLCRVRRCQNPAHMELVTHAENLRRAKRREECPHGHALMGANLYLNPSGHRCCRSCRRDAVARFMERANAS